MSLLGIDIGTTGCKAAAFSAKGRCHGVAYREYATLYPAPGLAELDSSQVWLSVQQVITEAAKSAGSDRVTALCVSSMGEAATPVSVSRREILGRCILGSDSRGAEYVERLLSRISAKEFYAINPNILAPCYTMPKLQWLRDHEPELYRKTECLLTWDGLVGFLLGCEPFISYSAANRTLLFDIHRQDWSDRLLDICAIDRRKLPRCLAAGIIAGEVSSAMAAQLGLQPDVKVVVGSHDQCCNALGAGITTEGHAVDGIGTFECITPVYRGIPQPGAMLAAGLNVEHHVVPELYVSFIYNQAGSLVRWFRDTFATSEKDSPGIYDRLAVEMPAAPTDLFVLPCFEPTGAPQFVSDASGTVVGLRTSTTRGEILKAIMEGVTYYFAASSRPLPGLGIDTSEFVATGGGAKSDAWLQLKADIMGVPYVRLATTESGLTGAAMLAGVATGALGDFSEAAALFVKRGRVFEPDAARRAVYQDKLTQYQELLPLVRGFMRETG
jgi:xylulokinase